MKKSWFNGKLFIISGASSGIGEKLTEKLIIDYGAKVIGIGRNEDKLLALQSRLPENTFSYKLFDVVDKENWFNFANELTENNIIPDVVINNAGYLPHFAKFDKYDEIELEKIINVNYMSCVYSSKALIPLLLNSKVGSIINVASAASLAPIVGTSIYSGSKAALKSFTECLIEDYRKKLYVACIMPGFTKTNIFSNQKTDVSKNKLINAVCAPLDKTVKKIIKKIKKRKKRIILGTDGRLMNFFYKLMPNFTSKTITSVLKKSKLELFDEVFND